MKPANRSLATCLRTAAVVFTTLVVAVPGVLAQSPKRLQIKPLSSRADLVSGGDALVEVQAPPGVDTSRITLTLNGNDVTSQLRRDASGSLRGLISGLAIGDNTLRAAIKSGGKSSAGAAGEAILTLKNHPITGPILSGPHLTPYECRTVESGLGQPLDANCSAAQKVEYFYRASNNTFKPLAEPNGSRP